jgi:hypothetical protein
VDARAGGTPRRDTLDVSSDDEVSPERRPLPASSWCLGGRPEGGRLPRALARARPRARARACAWAPTRGYETLLRRHALPRLGELRLAIRLGESRTNVEKAFGVGRSIRRGLVSYFGGHLVNYWFHDGLYKQVEYLETRWSGYRTRSGVHFGSSRRELRPLYVTCAKGNCGLLAGPWPDPVGTGFTMRHGKVVDIIIGSFG